MTDALALVGAAAITIGFGLMWLPLGFVALGVTLCVVALVLSWVRAHDSGGPKRGEQ